MSLTIPSNTALLFHQHMRMREPGQYLITAHVPTGEGRNTRVVVYHVRRITEKRWVLTDEVGVILENSTSKRDACNEADKRLARLVADAETRAAGIDAAAPPSPSVKPRYAFDRSVASAVLLELSPEYMHASLAHGEKMITEMLTGWREDRSPDMAEFARRWLASRPAAVQEGP